MIRNANKNDISQIIPLVMTVLIDMELSFLELVSKEDMELVLAEAIADERYRYSYQRALIYEENNKVLGVAYSYPSSDEEFIDEPLESIMSRYGYEGVKLFTDKETLSDEWYLDTISTKEEARGKGIGTALIDAVTSHAQSKDYHRLGLNVDVSNPLARKLYERIGFKKVGEITISQHIYEHMQKEI